MFNAGIPECHTGLVGEQNFVSSECESSTSSLSQAATHTVDLSLELHGRNEK